MNTDSFATFDGLEGLWATARDDRLRLTWCNDAFARLVDRPRTRILGTPPEEILPPALARDRAERIRRTLDSGEPDEFHQLWRGVRWQVRIVRTDPGPGVFTVATQAIGPGDRTPVSPAADLGDLAVLSARELEVLHHLAEGKTVNEVAAALFRSPKTIGRHAENIHRKMDYANRAALVRDATRRGVTGFTTDQWHALIRRRPRHPAAAHPRG